MTEYVHRSTFNMTNLNTAHKRQDRFRLYHIVQNDFATTIAINENQALAQGYSNEVVLVRMF